MSKFKYGGQRKDEFLKEAKERLHESINYWRENHDACKEDYLFFHKEGAQWEENLKKDREDAGRPCVSIHLLIQFIQLIVNQQRQNKLANKLSPIGSTDANTVAIVQDIVSYIERRAKINTETIQAYEDAVIAGMGAVRIDTEYQHYESFEQDIAVEVIKEPWNKLYIDPSAKKELAEDMEYCFILKTVKKKDFKKQYPESSSALSIFHEDSEYIINQEMVQIAEYYRIEEKEKTLIGLNDGRVMYWEDLTDWEKIEYNQQIARISKRKIPKVMYYKITESEVLEEKELTCEQIPIIPVYGAKYIERGKKIYYGIIRHTKDPQRMYNVYNNTILEYILNTCLTPFVAVEGTLEGVENKWKSLHKYNYGVVTYKPRTDDGMEAPPPTRMPFAQIPPEIERHLGGVKQDLSSTTGIYSAKLGNTSNETSGKAISARIGQSDISTYHFLDNFQNSFANIGKIFLQIIPTIFDTYRIIRIRDVDGREKALMLNSAQQEPNLVMEHRQKIQEESDKIRVAEQEIHNKNFKHYDVEVTAEITQKTKRAEQLKNILEFVELLPEAHRIYFSDIIAENMDVSNREEMVERSKKLPEIQMMLQQQAHQQQMELQQQQQQAQMEMQTQAQQQKQSGE